MVREPLDLGDNVFEVRAVSDTKRLLREAMARALGYTKAWVEDRKEPGHWMWSLKGSAPIPGYGLPPLDWNRVHEVVDLAVAKDSHGYTDALFKETDAASFSEGHGRQRATALATKEEMLTAALRVLEVEI